MKKKRVEIHFETDFWEKFKLESLKLNRSTKAQAEFILKEWMNGRLALPSK